MHPFAVYAIILTIGYLLYYAVVITHEYLKSQHNSSSQRDEIILVDSETAKLRELEEPTKIVNQLPDGCIVTYDNDEAPIRQDSISDNDDNNIPSTSDTYENDHDTPSDSPNEDAQAQVPPVPQKTVDKEAEYAATLTSAPRMYDIEDQDSELLRANFESSLSLGRYEMKTYLLAGEDE